MKILNKYNSLPDPIKASIWFLLSSVFIAGIKFFVTPIHTRIMSEESFGTIGLFNAWQSTLSAIITLSLAGGVFNNGLLDFKEKRASFTASMLGLSSLSAVIWYLIFLAFKDFFVNITNLTSLQLTIMFLGFLINPALGYWSAEQKFDYKYKILTLVTVIGAFVPQVAAIVAAFYLPGNKANAVILTSGLVYILINSFIYVKILLRDKIEVDLKYWKYVLVFNLPLIPHYLSFIVLSQSDRIMIAKFEGEDKAGIYILGYTVATLLQVFYAAINASMSPFTLKKMRTQNYSEIGTVSKYVLLIYAIFSTGLIAFAPEIVYILAPPNYSEATWVIPPVIIGLYFFAVAGFFTNIEFYHKKTVFIMISTTIAAITNIILNLIFIPMYGFLAAAYTTTIAYLIFMIIHYYFLKKIERNYIYNISFFIKVTIAFIIMSFAFMLVYKYFILRISISLIVLLIIFIYRRLLLQTIKKLLSK